LVFPDGTGPALLSCLIGGIPLNRVHELQFAPGEVRANVDYNSINALASRPPSQSYLDILDRGRVELKELRANPDLLRNVKDIEYEQEREAELKELEKKKEEEKARQLEVERKKKEKRLQRQNQTKNEIDFDSLGVVGTTIAGATVLASIFGSNETETKEDVVDATSNTTDIGSETLNSTSNVVSTPSDEETLRVDDQPIEDEDDDIPSAYDDVINEDEVVKISSAVAAENYEDDWLSSISDIMNEDDKDAFQ